jgi:gamma-glutamyl:cysteine ligase YbdK (ATP-grasp superfamily)
MQPLSLFEAVGIEIEYMIANAQTLSVSPLADELLRDDDGEYCDELEHGDIVWSNELVMHLVELKGRQPFRSLEHAWQPFQEQVGIINQRLESLDACLLPGGVHPWMDPASDARLWSRQNSEIYQAFDRIFGCRGHGWTNLQSMHINLPFSGDDEFGRLHAAIRLLLPIMPALAASSPILDSVATGLMDSRLEAYRTNAQMIPSVSGAVIPEPFFSIGEYREMILERLYRDMEPHDQAGILRYEWVNARGAIARFERNTIEIRVLDVQEHPAADLAIAWAIVHVLKALVDEQWCSCREQKAWAVEELRPIYNDVVRNADQADIANERYCAALGGPEQTVTAGSLWAQLIRRAVPVHPVYTPLLDSITTEGVLARRILRETGPAPDHVELHRLLERLALCLAQGKSFISGINPA